MRINQLKSIVVLGSIALSGCASVNYSKDHKSIEEGAYLSAQYSVQDHSFKDMEVTVYDFEKLVEEGCDEYYSFSQWTDVVDIEKATIVEFSTSGDDESQSVVIPEGATLVRYNMESFNNPTYYGTLLFNAEKGKSYKVAYEQKNNRSYKYMVVYQKKGKDLVELPDSEVHQLELWDMCQDIKADKET
ncbi:hypothetical protein [Enterovibrio sp. 27052020O]|uniref:hypothetical protein n=1 Tax=Enterovibrio sp. 27052020O TaxID=3241166 RepID=UPI003890E155